MPKTDLVTTVDLDFLYLQPQKPRKDYGWNVEEKENEEGGQYVKLDIVEGYTGYQGRSIWGLIYGENCFKGDINAMCMEERMLNRIISGLHAAINTNICENFEKDGKWEPNLGFFWGAVGNFPDRIQNIYYFYSILLRYATKIDRSRLTPLKGHFRRQQGARRGLLRHGISRGRRHA